MPWEGGIIFGLKSLCFRTICRRQSGMRQIRMDCRVAYALHH